MLSEEDARAIENAVLGKGRLLKIDAVDGSIARAMCNAAYMLGFERGKTDAYLSKQDWIRVEDALPVVPDDFGGIDVWAADGDSVLRLRVARALPLPDWYTHWRYAEQTPAPPEQPTTQDAK